MSLTWMVLFIVLIVIELMTVNLVSIWFAVGALASFILSFWVSNVTWQIAVFVGVSFISLLLTRKIVSKVRGSEVVRTNLDRVIGQVGFVTEEITKYQAGEVKVDGKKWSAISSKKIKVGSKVEILSIDGVKLNVKEIKEED